MGFPQTGPRALYMNSASDVEVFMRRFHMNNWRIYNTCNNRYDLSKSHPSFKDRVLHCGWAAGNSTTIEHVVEVVVSIDKYLNEDTKRIIAVHGWDDQDRAGVIICSYLLYSGSFDSPGAVINYYNTKRGPSPCLILPSQIRLIQNFYTYLIWNKNMGFSHLNPAMLSQPTKAVLKRILMTPVPKAGQKKTACKPLVEIYNNKVLFPPLGTPIVPHIVQCDKRYEAKSSIETCIRIDCNHEIEGDVILKFFHSTNLIGGVPLLEPLFKCHFHTSFQLGYGDKKIQFTDFDISQLDDAKSANSLVNTTYGIFANSFRVRILVEYA